MSRATLAQLHPDPVVLRDRRLAGPPLLVPDRLAEGRPNRRMLEVARTLCEHRHEPPEIRARGNREEPVECRQDLVCAVLFEDQHVIGRRRVDQVAAELCELSLEPEPGVLTWMHAF